MDVEGLPLWYKQGGVTTLTRDRIAPKGGGEWELTIATFYCDTFLFWRFRGVYSTITLMILDKSILFIVKK